MRLLGVDYGRRRIGLAIGDDSLRIASPLDTLAASGDAERDAQAVAARAAAEGVDGLVVGVPLNMDDTEGPQAHFTRRFIAALRDAGGLPVHEQDERLSSHAADELLAGGEFTRGGRRARRDKLAAQVILQAYLDAARGTGL